MDRPIRSIMKITLLNMHRPSGALGSLLVWLRFLCLLGRGATEFAEPSSNEESPTGDDGLGANQSADNRQIEGYASFTSVPVGGNIDLFVNTKDASYTLTRFSHGVVWWQRRPQSPGTCKHRRRASR